MRISLRIAELKDDSTRAINKMFVSRNNVKLTLYPITMIENPKCDCGEPAKHMLEDFRIICNKCLVKNLSMSTLEEKEDVSIPLNKQVVQQLRFEWTIDHERWYPIKGSRIKLKDWEEFISKLRDSMVNGSLISLEADYDKDTKILSVVTIV